MLYEVITFRKHTDEEIAIYADMAKQIFNGANNLTDDLVQMNLALINGRNNFV